jgi:hypothetical protein
VLRPSALARATTEVCGSTSPEATMGKLGGPAAAVVVAAGAEPRGAPLADAHVVAPAGDPEARLTEHDAVASSSSPTRNATAALERHAGCPRPPSECGLRAQPGTRAMLLHLLKMRGASGVAPSGSTHRIVFERR